MDLNLDLVKFIDHTLLKPNTGIRDIHKLCEEALHYKFRTVCVNSVWVQDCFLTLKNSEVGISAVCGFPLGANASEAKAFEAALCVEQGASEIDMVLSVGQLLDGNTNVVINDIRKVVDAVSNQAIVKVIIETGYLNEEQIEIACKCSEEAGAHYVKTSTGFGLRGASLDDIVLMRKSVSKHIGVKASGGIRDLQAAMKMIEVGATRLGVSSSVAIMEGLVNKEEY